GMLPWHDGAVDGSFSPGKGGGEGLAYGRKGKGIRIHRLTEGVSMPLSTRPTPANGAERAQVLPRLAALRIRTGTRGRPRKRLQILATEEGEDHKDPRRRVRKRGSRAQIPQRVWTVSKPGGRPIKKTVPRFQAERTVAGFQRQYRRLVVRWERLAACFNAF